ncbi:hypothetical protein D3C87_1649450 [compost metagenome]
MPLLSWAPACTVLKATCGKNSFQRWCDQPFPGGRPSAGEPTGWRLRKASICAFHGLRSSTLENCDGNGYSPGWRMKASSAAGEGPLRAMLFGSCVGAGPTIGTGKVRGGAGSVGSSFSVPNSSNSSSC